MSYYDDYVGHMLRVYFAEIAPDRMEGAAKQNCAVCQAVLQQLPEKDRVILREVFQKSRRTPLNETVKNCAGRRGLHELEVWQIVRNVTKEIARERGLL